MSGLKDAWALMKDLELSIEKAESRAAKSETRINNFQAVTFTILGIIVAALAFVGVSKFTDLSCANPSNWQIATWVVMLSAIIIMTLVLAIASIKALWRK